MKCLLPRVKKKMEIFCVEILPSIPLTDFPLLFSICNLFSPCGPLQSSIVNWLYLDTHTCTQPPTTQASVNITFVC